jgi:hypothetical protein
MYFRFPPLNAESRADSILVSPRVLLHGRGRPLDHHADGHEADALVGEEPHSPRLSEQRHEPNGLWIYRPQAIGVLERHAFVATLRAQGVYELGSEFQLARIETHATFPERSPQVTLSSAKRREL